MKPSAHRRRLDLELVRRGLVGSRTEAHELIARGGVVVAGTPSSKPSRLVAASEPIEVLAPTRRFVSRAGVKLDAALERFGVDVRARLCLDAGASTGGFTDCLLQRGAARVVAVDVGYGQLDARLRRDPRVLVRERINIRRAALDDLGGVRFDVVTADLSFISLVAVVPTLMACADTGADLVLLVKPQFEAGRAEADRGGGVIRDPEVRRSALVRVASTLAGAGASIMGAMASPLAGAAGNVELLLHARATGGPGELTAQVTELLDAALAEAGTSPTAASGGER